MLIALQMLINSKQGIIPCSCNRVLIQLIVVLFYVFFIRALPSTESSNLLPGTQQHRIAPCNDTQMPAWHEAKQDFPNSLQFLQKLWHPSNSYNGVQHLGLPSRILNPCKPSGIWVQPSAARPRGTGCPWDNPRAAVQPQKQAMKPGNEHQREHGKAFKILSLTYIIIQQEDRRIYCMFPSSSGSGINNQHRDREKPFILLSTLTRPRCNSLKSLHRIWAGDDDGLHR